jgi:hypothetical protein
VENKIISSSVFFFLVRNVMVKARLGNISIFLSNYKAGEY